MHMADNQFTSEFLLLRCISLHWHERPLFLDAAEMQGGREQRTNTYTVVCIPKGHLFVSGRRLMSMLVDFD